MSAEAPRPSNTGKIIVAIVIVALASGLAFSLYKNFQKDTTIEDQATNITELTTEIDDLKVDLENYARELDNQELDIAQKERLLAEKEQQLTEKQKKIDQLIAANKISKSEAADLQKRVDELQYYITKYQKEITSLKMQVDSLNTENQALTGTIDTIKGEMHKMADDLKQKEILVTASSILRTANFKYWRVRDSGKEQEETEFRKGSLEKLKICFDIIENPAAKPGARDIYMAIHDPKNNVIKDMNNGSGYFNAENKELVYSTKTSVNYNRTTTNVCITFTQPSGYDYSKGKHTVKLYGDGFQIGSTSFEVK